MTKCEGINGPGGELNTDPINNYTSAMLTRALAMLVILSLLPTSSFAGVEVPPNIGPWQHLMCRNTFFGNATTSRNECIHWQEGQWTTSGCVNRQDPSPWLDESVLLPKAAAYPGPPVAWITQWLQPGQSLPSSGCWAGSPAYIAGVERFNLGLIDTGGVNVMTRRDRGVSCPAGSSASGNACITNTQPPVNKQGGCEAEGNDEPVGNPCSPATGNKYQAETDYAASGGGMAFTRHYNSLGSQDLRLGFGWTSSFQKRLETFGSSLIVRRADGRGEQWQETGGVWQGDADTKLLLAADATGYTLTLPNGDTERYNLSGKVLSETTTSGQTTTYGYDTFGRVSTVTGPFGHVVTLFYDADGRLSTMTDPEGEVYIYAYDANRNLVQVTYPDSTQRVYHYEDTNYPNHLTGITDENGDRFATYAYDADGKALSTGHAQTDNGAPQEQFTLVYDSGTQTSVTDPVGTVEVRSYEQNLGIKNLLSRINQTDGKGITQQFDANNNLISRTDEEGRTTTHTYNADNQRIAMIEAAGTAEERATTFEYLSTDIDLPTWVISPSVLSGADKEVITTYDSNNNPTSITQTGFAPDGTPVSRSTSFQYNTLGQVIQIDGPRTDISDITTLAYYECATGAECGQLQSVTNALSQTTTYDTYDAHGRVTQITDPNSVVTTTTYDLRGRVLSTTQTPPTGSVRATTFAYDGVGQLTSVTTPDGVTLTYTYDAAHDLRSIVDNLGNKIEYSYDLKGNRTQEDTKDPGGTLVRTVDTLYDIRNRVEQINAAGSITQLVNDAVGNLTSETDPNVNPSTTHQYDALDRLGQTLDALGNSTDYDYDVNDQLTQVTVPNSASTQFSYDDLGNLLQESSPDRGPVTNIHDDAGNITSITDARGVTSLYSYDALHRVTGIDYPSTDEDITFTYDTCTNGTGRLCSVQDQSGTTSLAYDAFGNVTQHTKDELGIVYVTQYTYDDAGRVLSMTYPDGREVIYGRDAVGRIQDIGTRAAPSEALVDVVSNRSYRADGLVTAQTFGNGLVESRTYDLQGRLLTQDAGTVDNQAYTYDANGNVVARSDAETADYQYDSLDRLSQELRLTDILDFTYDANGNRLTRALNGASETYTYAPASNQLTGIDGTSVVLDATGNTLSDQNGTRTFTYNQAGRVSEVSQSGQPMGSYVYNYLGQRTRKVTQNGSATKVFHYDLLGNLIAETNASGSSMSQYIYADATPVGLIPGSVNSGGEASLIGYWDFETDTGSSVGDVSGNNHAGTLVGDAIREDDPVFGTGLRLDGQGDYLQLPDLSGEFTTEATVSLWIKLDQATPASAAVSGIVDLGDTKNKTSLYPKTSTKAEFNTFRNGALVKNIPLSAAVDRAQWHHLAITAQPGNSGWVVYQNGTLLVSKTGKNSLSQTSVFTIGKSREDNFTQGVIDEVRLYNRALSAGEVAALANEPPSPPPPPGQVYALHTDHLGTPQVMTDQGQNVIWDAHYNPFGSATISPATVTNNLRFPGQYYDEESRLHYNWNRYYDPTTGRYITSDPTGIDADLNTYAHALNNTLKFVDLNGLEAIVFEDLPEAGGGSLSVGFGGFIQGPLAGVGAESGVAFGSNGSVCFFTQTCFTVQVGVAAGLGASISLGPGKLCSGTQIAHGGFVTGGVGILGSGQGLVGSDGKSAAITKAFGGVGGGDTAGSISCAIRFTCLIEAQECKNCAQNN